MRKFKVGDKVRLTEAGIKYILYVDELGDAAMPKSIVITDVDECDPVLPYLGRSVDKLNKGIWWFHEKDLRPSLNMRNK